MGMTILLKRGRQADLDNLTLAEGEPALAYNAEKSSVDLYVGDGKGGIILVNQEANVPTKVSELLNDSGYQTENDVTTAITTAISKTGHAVFKKVPSVPTAENAEDNVLYLVMNTSTSHYDIYAKVDNEVVLLDDTTVDLSGYVEKVTGMGLSSNDYTAAEKDKLAGIESGANNYTHPSTHPANIIAQDSTHRFVNDEEKEEWNSKLGSDDVIDGGTF